MKKFYFFLSLVLALMTSAPAMAVGLGIGYCDGVIATSDNGTVAGLTGNNVTIREAIYLSPDMLSAFRSCKITKVNCGLYTAATALPDTLQAFIRTDLNGADITTGKVAAAAGWATATLDSAINVADYLETGLYVGFKFKQAKKLNIICFLGSVTTDGCAYISKSGNWTNYHTYGALPVEAVVEGDNLPQHDLALSSVTSAPGVIKLGNNITINATVQNRALADAVNPVIKYNIGGLFEGSYPINQTLAYREKANVSFTIDASSITEEADLSSKFTVNCAGDSIVDENPDDNTKNITISFLKDPVKRKMLVEEATGAWCGWCVRGLVGMNYMRSTYPDQFIGIGVHNQDTYAVAAYNSWMVSQISGFPSCIVNRDGNVIDPNSSYLQSALQNMDATTPATIKVSGEEKDNSLTINSATTFIVGKQGKSYNIAYVLVEDNLPIKQTNYYSGGSRGAMGGYENLGSSVDTTVNDVARGIYPAPAGVSIEAPDTIAKGSVIEHTLTVEMPTIAKQENTFLVAILIDNETGEVVNAEKGAITYTTSGINDVNASKTIKSVTYYDLSGRNYDTPVEGMNIVVTTYTDGTRSSAKVMR